MRAYRYPFITALAIAGLLLAASVGVAQDITVTARLGQESVSAGSDVLLVVRIEGKFRRSVSPQLPEIEGLFFYDSGTSQSFSIVNGRRSSSVEYRYTITPAKQGTYEIAPITVTFDNKEYTANPVTLEVTPAAKSVTPPSQKRSSGRSVSDDNSSADNRSIFIEASVDRDTVYVNQQVTWTLGYYTDGRVSLLRSPNYTPPEAEGFWVEDLPPQNKYYSVLEGRQYLVNEIKRGYFPTAPGIFTIESARVDLVVDDFSGRNMVDDFFNRGFRGGFGKQHTLQTEPIEIAVLPLPAAGRPSDFTGVVAEQLDVSMSSDKQVVQVGEPVNVSVVVQGTGNIKTVAPPKLPESDRYKLYESGSSSDTFKRDYVVTGRKKYDFVVIPQVEGKWELPAVKMSYFDPVEKRYRTTQSLPIALEVAPGAQEEGRKVVYAGGGDDFEVINKDIRFIHPVPSSIAMGTTGLLGSRLFLALHALPLLAVLASLFIERRNRRYRDDVALARATRALRDAERQLDVARKHAGSGDTESAVAALSASIDGFFSDKMNVARAGLTQETVDDYLASREIDDGYRASVRRLRATSDAARYAATPMSRGDVEALLDETRTVLRKLEKGLA